MCVRLSPNNIPRTSIINNKIKTIKMTVKNFMLKKFPTNEYMDCPIPRHHWEVIQEYASVYSKHILNELLQRPDLLIDAVQNENTDNDGKSLVELIEAENK